MLTESDSDLQEVLTLRFQGKEEDGTEIHELRAAHVAEVLTGLVGLSSDFARAGAFGDGPAGSEVLVRPAQEGSFIIEVLRVAQDLDPTTVAAYAAAGGMPTLGQIIWWATKSARAEPSGAEYLENGNVLVSWQDNTVQEIPQAAWRELNKRDRRRKKQLRQIMAPLSDQRVSSVEVEAVAPAEIEAGEAEAAFTLTRPDYNAVQPEDDITETSEIFDTEAQMSAIDFDDPTRWRVKTTDENRLATVEDDDFLGRVARGLAIRKSDIFNLKVREDTVEKNGRTRRTWTVLEVISHRRAASDDDDG
ncbi:hypothetical protein N866_00070 [Actinotalea ferrariae CF5-4]|uniref:Uncharacterized protein n=1 Tax=Actinotalea ferrariae CF5-4 TaxID=948458 RepID=A0A021VVK0_9CELL|nr:hypothetical protein [Actinotalea ferrariae]EYR65219.1 hypothetical protein N866_00070 [Actinotalea ferrariae CF5-4]